MSKVFVTSDTHFGHDNIIRYCERPFGSAKEMDTALIERWNSRVSFADTVYFLGDFAMGRGVHDLSIISTFKALHGNKRIVLGNHDQPSKKFDMVGLKSLVQSGHVKAEILSDIHEEKIDGQRFVMSHYPMDDWNGRFKRSIHLHGHCHKRPILDLEEFGGPADPTQPSCSAEMTRCYNGGIPRRYDVGVDMYGGPVQITGDLRYLDDPKGWDG